MDPVNSAAVDANSGVKSEQIDKEIMAYQVFLFSHVDKLPSLYTALFLVAIAAASAAATGSSDFKQYHQGILQTLCATCPPLICVSVTCFAYAGYFKELGYTSGFWYKALAFVVLALQLLLLVLVTLLVIALEHAEPKYVMLPVVATGLGTILSWQMPMRNPKSLWTCLSEMCKCLGFALVAMWLKCQRLPFLGRAVME